MAGALRRSLATPTALSLVRRIRSCFVADALNFQRRFLRLLASTKSAAMSSTNQVSARSLYDFIAVPVSQTSHSPELPSVSYIALHRICPGGVACHPCLLLDQRQQHHEAAVHRSARKGPRHGAQRPNFAPVDPATRWFALGNLVGIWFHFFDFANQRMARRQRLSICWLHRRSAMG